MPLSTYSINLIRDHMMRTATWSKTTTRWISLHTAAPGLTGTNEVTETWYDRVRLDAADANWDAVVNGIAENISAITFPSPTGMAGTLIVTHAGLWEAETAGNFLIGGALLAPKTINNGDAAPSFPIGELAVAFS